MKYIGKFKNLVIIMLFILLIGIGFSIYPDFGISPDEYNCRDRAIVNAKYITELFNWHVYPDDILPLASYENRDHGVLFDLVALGLENLYGLTDLHDIFVQKHFLNYLVFLGGVAAIYLMALRRYKSWLLGVTAVLLIVLSPRIFADAFYNAKDIIFMSFFAIAMNTALSFIQKPTLSKAILHALATAIAVDTRIMGIIIIPLTFLFLILNLFSQRYPVRKVIMTSLVYLLATAGLVVLFWPTLWSDPLNNFLYVFNRLSRYEVWSKEVLYMGKYVMSTELPWHYIMGWMFVTTPLVYQTLFVVGVLSLAKRLMIDRKLIFWKEYIDLHDLFMLASVVGPILSIIVFHSVVYDGWRHLYFIYPAFILLTIHGLNTIYVFVKDKNRFFKLVLVVALAASFLSTAVWMFKAHPLQNVYFNKVMGTNWKDKFELDYWGLANRAALEYILDNDQSAMINVSAVSAANLYQTFYIIQEDERARLNYLNDFGTTDFSLYSIENPLYILNNFKRLKDHDILLRDPNYQLFYEKRVSGEVIVQVHKWIG